jgi:hypothetical protein
VKNGFQALSTCTTVLSLPGTRQLIEIQALKQRGTRKKRLFSQTTTVLKYIHQQYNVLLAANLTIKNNKQLFDD